MNTPKTAIMKRNDVEALIEAWARNAMRDDVRSDFCPIEVAINLDEERQMAFYIQISNHNERNYPLYVMMAGESAKHVSTQTSYMSVEGDAALAFLANLVEPIIGFKPVCATAFELEGEGEVLMQFYDGPFGDYDIGNSVIGDASRRSESPTLVTVNVEYLVENKETGNRMEASTALPMKVADAISLLQEGKNSLVARADGSLIKTLENTAKLIDMEYVPNSISSAIPVIDG